MTLRGPLTNVVLLLVLAAALVIALGLGFFHVAPADVLRALFGDATAQQELVVGQLRLPRALLAVLVGAALALSGTLLQGVTGNGLADPGIVGIHAGAGVGVMLLLVLPVSVREASALAQPVAAFVGAGAAALLVYGFAFKDGGVTATRLLLVGVGVAAGLSAVMLLLALRMNDQVFAYAVAWQSGSVAGKGWAPIRVLAPLLAALVPLALLQARRLDVLGFGRDVATGLGVAVERQRLGLLALSVGLSASAVALAGSISFVGLIAPHMARSIVGPRHANLLPSAALLGGLLVLVADTAGRTLFGTTELPAGVMVAAVGAPYFLYLLGRSKA